mgnify:CR=1 FL=1
MGSSTVVNSRFNNWPFKKKIFQISHLKKINNQTIETIYINKEKPIYKILKLPELITRIYRYFNSSKKKLLVIEGASWIFYSFIVIFFFKFFFSNIKIIYISHSIESEIRKKYSKYDEFKKLKKPIRSDDKSSNKLDFKKILKDYI